MAVCDCFMSVMCLVLARLDRFGLSGLTWSKSCVTLLLLFMV